MCMMGDQIKQKIFSDTGRINLNEHYISPSLSMLIHSKRTCFAVLIACIQIILATFLYSQFFHKRKIETSTAVGIGRDVVITSLQNETLLAVQNLKYPIVIPHGSITYNRIHLTIHRSECYFHVCSPVDQPGLRQSIFHQDVITLFIVNHYYHFVYETVLQLYPLLAYNFYDKYPNATIVCFYSNGFTANNFEMLKALQINFPWSDVRRGRRDRLYTVAEGYNLIIARHNNFHTKTQENVEYNRNLLNLIRGRLTSQPANPDLFLYVSRQGIRRAIKQEWELYLGLKNIYPNLTFFFPDNHTVETQKETFAKSRLIISPHGASLTNALFSNWDILTLIELTPKKNPLTYRDNLWVKNHFVLQCPGIPCSPRSKSDCDAMDVNVTMAVQVIHEIIEGNNEGKNISMDYFINASYAS